MRALLVMLMLTLLPLQFSAAAQVSCCDHMAAPQGTHAQHLLLRHMSAAEGIDNAVATAADFDLDCGTCHANCVATITAMDAPWMEPAGAEQIAPLDPRAMPTWDEQPYRPQWHAPTGSGHPTSA